MISMEIRASHFDAWIRPSRALYAILLIDILISLLLIMRGGSWAVYVLVFLNTYMITLVSISYAILQSLRSIAQLIRAECESPLIGKAGNEVYIDLVLKGDISRLARIHSLRVSTDPGLKLSKHSIVNYSGYIRIRLYLTGYVGAHRVMGVELLVKDLAFLFNLNVFLEFEYPIEIHIIPPRKAGILDIETLIARYTFLEALATRRRGAGSDVLWIREYRDGDDFRKIAWKQTAKISKLMVKEYESRIFKNILIIASIHDGFFIGDPPPLNILSQAILDLVASAVEKGLNVKVGVATEKGIKVSSVLTTMRIEDIYRVISLIEWPLEPNPYPIYSGSNRIIRWFTKTLVRDFCREPCMVVLFIDPLDDLDMMNIATLQTELSAMRHKLRVFITIPAVLRFIYSSTPSMEDIAYVYRRSIYLRRYII